MKKRKKFSGMTLMEIIISLAILAVLTLVLVQTSNTINMYIKSANKVNQKTIQQAPVAEIGDIDAGRQVETKVNINISGGPGGKSFSQVVQGNAYQAGEPKTEYVEVSEGVTTAVVVDEIGGNLNMQYIVDLEAVTNAAATTAAPVVTTAASE